MEILKKFLLISVFFVVTLFILGEIFLPPDDAGKAVDLCGEYEGEWYVVTDSGEKVLIDYGEVYECEPNDTVIFETVLDMDIDSNIYLCFRSARQEMEFYVGEELRQTYTDENSRLAGNTSAPRSVFCKVTPEDKGKNLRLVTRSNTAYNGTLYNVYYGDRADIWKMYFRVYGPEVLVGITMLLVGFFSTLISIIMGIFNNKQFELAYLGAGTCIAAIWLITNSALRDFFFPNVSLVSDTAYMCTLLLPIPFLVYINYEQNGYYEKIYKFTGWLVAIIAVTSISLHYSGIADFCKTVTFSSLAVYLSVAIIIITILIDVKTGRVKKYTMAAIGLAIVCISAIIQYLMYFRRNDVLKGSLIGLGMIIMMVCAIIKTIQDYLDIEREKQRAISANESKSMFLANMSHEIRTPLNAILGMDEIIMSESKEQTIQEYAKDIQSAGKSLLSLINDILDFTKIESGRMEIVTSEYSVASLINDCYNIISIRVNEKGLDFKVRCYPNMPGKLLGDEVRIRQIIINLLSNAVKYTQTGSVTLSVGCEQIDEERIMLKVSVRDTGIGIKPSEQEKLFDSFKRIDLQRNRNVEGTGLGLAITKQLIDLMDGKISLKSDYGKGSIFYVDIPQIIASKEPMGQFIASSDNEKVEQEKSEDKKVIEQRGANSKARNVLVVDDVAINIKVLRGLLKNKGLEIDSALSGMECIEKTGEKKYDLIFLDHMMPDMDGFETFKHMREDGTNLNNDTPVIMLTANAVQGAKDEYISFGFSDYLSKPIQRQQLEDMIEKYLPNSKN